MDSNRDERERTWNRGGFPTWAKTLVAVAVVLLFSLIFFRVETFEVSGNVRYSAQEIADASGITEGDILMAVNKTRTAGRLLARLPYVEQVRIYKEMPGTIRFEVVECSAAFMAKSEFSTYWLLSGSGKLLEEIETADSGYPLVSGVALTLPTAGEDAAFDDADKAQLGMELVEEVAAAGLTESVSEINVEDSENVTLLYGGYLEVRLGDGSDGAYKLQYLLAVLGELESGKKGVLDLSFSDGEQAVFHPVT